MTADENIDTAKPIDLTIQSLHIVVTCCAMASASTHYVHRCVSTSTVRPRSTNQSLFAKTLRDHSALTALILAVVDPRGEETEVNT